MSDRAPITHVQLAQQCVHIADNCAHWASSLLTLDERLLEPVRADALKRFLDDMKQRLEIIEQWEKI